MTQFEKLVLRLLATILRRQWNLFGGSQIALAHNDRPLLEEVEAALRDAAVAERDETHG